VIGSLVVARLMLPANGFTQAHRYPNLTLTDALTRRASVGTVLYLGLLAILTTGVGAILRDTAGTIATMLTLLYGSSIVAMFVTSSRWQVRIHRIAPMDAGLAIQSTRDLASAPIGAWAGLGVLSAYAGAAVLIGALLFRLRDA
jgi:ABC-2 type transport system permease protein